MSTTGPTRDDPVTPPPEPSGVPDRPGAIAGLGTPTLVLSAVSVLAGIAVYLVGLPESPSLFGTPLSDLTLPAALLVALGGVSAAVAASRRAPWRVVDIVVASVLGVAGGLVFALWNIAWRPLSESLLPPASAVVVGIWLFPGVLAVLVIRKPGAAVYTELRGGDRQRARRQPVGLRDRLVRAASRASARRSCSRCCSTGRSACRPRCWAAWAPASRSACSTRIVYYPDVLGRRRQAGVRRHSPPAPAW